jgi:hypothetical protein
MKARAGDWLIIEGTTVQDHRREGRITEVRAVDGSPPYLVRWRDTDHVSLVFPGAGARIETPQEHRHTARAATR